MGSHDKYGKQVLRLATNGEAVHCGSPIEVDFGAGLPGRIDGAIGGRQEQKTRKPNLLLPKE